MAAFCSGIDLDPDEIDLDYDSRSFEQELALVAPFRTVRGHVAAANPGHRLSPRLLLGGGHRHRLPRRHDRLCAEDAQFGYPIVRSMASPSTHMWTYLAGPQWAKRLLLTGDMIDGTTAARAGFVLEAVPADELAEHTHALARRVATVPNDISAANKSICNKVLELMGYTLAQELSPRAQRHRPSIPRRPRIRPPHPHPRLQSRPHLAIRTIRLTGCSACLPSTCSEQPAQDPHSSSRSTPDEPK